jgi:sec-independent protein translocase protein TatC
MTPGLSPVVLSRLRLVTARFLWVNIKYAVLASLIVAAVLTPSPDPWNQFLFAAPMFALYLIGIVVAWLAHPKQPIEPGLRLVFTAAAIDRAWQQRRLRGNGLLTRLERRNSKVPSV